MIRRCVAGARRLRVTRFRGRRRGSALAAIGLLALVTLAADAHAATIRGTVLDGASAPVVSAYVTVYTAEEEPTYVSSSFTSSSGQYEIGALPAGTYKVRFHPPVGTGANLMPQWYDGKSDADSADSVALAAAGSIAQGIDARLLEGAHISGRVTAQATGAPLPDAYIDVYDEAGDWVALAEADADGRYRVNGLATGSYRVSASAGVGDNYVAEYYDDAPTFEQADPVAAVAGEEQPGIDFALRPGGRVAGHVADAETGEGLGDISVYVTAEDGATAYGSSDEDGDYVVNGVASGRQTVGFHPSEFPHQSHRPQWYDGKSDVEQADPISVTEGQLTSGIDAALDPAGRITGTVTGRAGQPLAGVRVELYEAGRSWSSGAVRTDENGRYRVTGLEPGSYRLGFRDPSGVHRDEYHDDAATLAAATAITLGDGELVDGIDARLETSGRITGRVTAADGGAGIRGVVVLVYAGSGVYLGSTTTGADGRYTATGLMGGTYRLNFLAGMDAPEPPPSPGGSPDPTGPDVADYASEWFDDQPSIETATAITVTAGEETPDIDAQLAQGGSIEGRIAEDGSGTPLPGIIVAAYAADGSWTASTSSDPSGRYTLRGLPSGSYRLRYWANDGGPHVSEYYDDAATVDDATLVTVATGQTTTVPQVGLARGGTIAGRVVDDAGTPAAGAYVSAYEQQTGDWVGSAEVGPDGSYTVRGLRTGSYRVSFGGGAYRAEWFDDADYLSADPVAVTAGELTADIDATLLRAVSIAGSVTDVRTGAPLSGVDVIAYDDASGYGYLVTTGFDGRYRISGLAPGSYRVRFEKPGSGYAERWYDGADSSATATVVRLAGGEQRSGIDAALVSGGGITGRATDAVTGAPVAGMTVIAFTEAGLTAAYGNTRLDGSYALDGLVTGSYHVSFRPADGLNYIAGWYGGDTRAEAVSVAVTHGETTAGIDRELHAGGRVTGVVRDAETGDPVANVSVNASGSIAGESHSGYVTSGPDGRFTVAGLPTGAFRLSFSPSGDGFLLDAARENVAVTAQQDTTLGDVGLAAGGRIAGTVLDHASGAPRLGATVMATSSSGTSRLAWSGADGRYSLGALPPGRYTVRFDDYNGYGTQWFDRSPTAGGAATVTVTARAVTPQIDASLARPPLSTSPPTIAGTTTQGQTLTATDGTWSGDPTAVTRQWLRCLAEEDYCWEIAGATQSTYTLGESDGGYRIAVAETAVNLGGTTTERSQLTDVVVPQPPLNTWAPSISGTPRSGEQLYASVGGWANNPTSYSYRWQRCNAFGSACAVIDSETDDWYTVRDADIGHTLTVVLIARNAGGESEPVVSTPSTAIVPAVPANLAAPTISGAPRQGERLTAEHGSWSGAPSGYDYSWRRCDAAGANCITSGSGSTYSLRAADVGRRIVVVVRAANAGGTSQPASSAPTDAVIASRPQSTDPPRISGIAKVGETLAASSGDWSNEPTSYTYSWLACPPDSACAPIAGATRTTYVPTESDVGNALVVRVTASNPAGAGTAATSAATDPVRARIPVNITRPSISGTAVEGATLTLVRGSWSEQPSSYEQQWWRCAASGSCTEIAGATGTQHLLGAADIGFRIVVRERAVNASGVSVAAVSDETATVAAGRPLNSVLPEIAGSAREGASLNAGNGSWTNAPIGFAYQWLSCATALDCRAIADATDQRYEARYADVGRRLMVEVTASNSAGAGAPARSALTAVVTEADPPETVISEQPPARTNGATQIVRFRAVPSSAALECRLGDDPFASCAGSRQFSGLAEGDYRFEARARDAVGRVDATPATAIWTVDRTAPETTITAGPEQPVHAGAVFAFSASEAGSTFQCAVDGAVYAACVSGAALDLAGLSPGDHTLRVRAIDAAGNADASGAMRQFSFANAAPDTALTMTPDAGVIALETAAAITAADGDGDELRYTLDLGDGRVVSGHLPQAPIAHTYQRSGIYLVRLEVTDGHETDVVTRLVTVALSEPLRADAGDDLIAVAGEALTLDGSGSRPSAGIERATWEFGDGGSANGLRTTHTWGTAGTYVATLAVEAGGRRVLDSARVHVVSPAAADGLGVTVVSGGGPVAGADVLVVTPAGQRVTAVTDGAGRARLRGLADGTHTVMTYGDGYLPASAPATVSGGSGSATVSLTPGDVAEATLMHRRLNREEIIALGIDPNNPENQNVVGFTVHLNGRPFNGWLNGDGLHGPGCTRDSCQIDDPDGAGGGGTTHVQRQGRSMVSTFTLPFQARWLKEFFEIKMTIYNLAAPEFVLRDGSARLELPSGLSLAPTARGEQQTQPVGDIVGGGHASASWIVRGDAAGEYTLSADYAATLAPFGASITARATTATPLKVWGGNALRAIIESDETYRDGYPMRVRVGLRNIADIPVYDAQVELGLADEQSGYVEQPRQQRAFGAREIPAGQTRWLGPWIVIPQRSGRLDLARSFARVARGEAFGGVELRTVPRDPTFLQTPRLTASSVAGSVKLDWEPVPGATAYEVFEAPDRRTPFGDVPSQTVTELAALLPEPAEGERPYYAISAIVGGRSTMVHPLVAAPSPAPLGTGDADPLGAPKGTCGLTTVTIGAAKLIASCFRKNGDVYTSSGRVRVNGIDLTPQNAVVSVDVAKAKISVSNVRLQLGTVVLYQGRFEWSPKVEKHFALAPNVRIGGLAVTGEMSVLVRTDRAELTGRIKLPEALGGVHGRLRLVGTNENGPKVDLFEISAGGARVGRLGLDELGLSYKRGSGGDLWTGTTQVSVPRGPSSMTLRGELKILNGGFKGASIEADHINQHIAYGVFLQRLRGGVEINPLTLEGGIGISAGPSVAGRTLLRVDGDVSIRFSDPQVYSVRGEVKIFDATVRSGYVRYTTSGLFEFGGEMGFEKGPFKARAGIDGWVDNMRAAEARGWGEFSVPGASFSAEGVVSSVGLAACRRGFGPDVGAGYRWGDRDVTIFASSCDIGPYRATRARDGAERFVVAEGQAVEVLAIRGDGGAPQVVLEGPNGERIAAPDGGAGIDRPELMLVQYPDHRTTYVALQRPAAGEWRISAVPGSAPVSGLERAAALPEPQVAAEVEPLGDRARLRWRVRPLEGQQVTFVERTERGARVIATADGASGSTEFTPLPDDTAGRKVIALVEQDGLPRRAIAVDGFSADPVELPQSPEAGAAPDDAAVSPAELPQQPGGARPAPAAGGGRASTPRSPAAPRGRTARPPAPARVVISRRRGGIAVATWTAVRGAQRYAVSARLGGGRSLVTTAKRHRLVLRGVRSSDRPRVSVRAIGADGRRGAARSATLAGARR